MTTIENNRYRKKEREVKGGREGEVDGFIYKEKIPWNIARRPS
jgi:hypothetical protein